MRGWLRLFMASPPVRMRLCVEQLAVRPGIRGRLQSVHGLCDGLNMTAMNLTMTQPAIPRGRYY